MHEYLTGDTNYSSFNDYAPSCNICEYPLTSLNMNAVIHYDQQTLLNESDFKSTLDIDIGYHNIDLLTKLDDAYNKVKYRSFAKVNIFNEEELKALSQIEISDTYFNSIKTIEDSDHDIRKNIRNIFFTHDPIDSTLCEMLCKIGLNETQIKEIKPIVSKVLHSVKVIFKSFTASNCIEARITNNVQGIGWHFDDFDQNHIYNGMAFTFTILGPGTITYSPHYKDFSTLQNHVENVDRVGYNDSLPLLDKTRVMETNIGEGLFFPAGADIAPLHSAPEYNGDRIMFVIRERTFVTYNPNLNECPAPSLLDIL